MVRLDIEPGIKKDSDGYYFVEYRLYRQGPFRSRAEAQQALYRLKKRVEEEEMAREKKRQVEEDWGRQQDMEEDEEDDWPPSPSPKMF